MRRALVGAAIVLAVLAAAVLVPEHGAVAQSHSEVVMSKKPKPKPTPTNNYGWIDPNKSTETVVPDKSTGADVNQGRDFLTTKSPMPTWTPKLKKRGTGADLPPANIRQQFNTFTPREQRYYQQLQGNGTPEGKQRMQDFLNQYWFQNT
jgi:hypothetical protein